MRRIRIGLAQIDCSIGDLGGNLDTIKKYARKASALEVDLVAFPELAISGYPPEDLLLKSHFVSDCLAGLDELVEFSRGLKGMVVVTGCLDSGPEGLYNAAAAVAEGRLIGIYHKQLLPNYGVFDEKRYFKAGRSGFCVEVAGVNVGLSICEDIWDEDGPPTYEALIGGAELIVNLNASPYHIGKAEARAELLGAWAARNRTAIAYVNMVGGQDELVFDGHSLVFSAEGETAGSALAFEEELAVFDIDGDEVAAARGSDPAWAGRLDQLDRNKTVVQAAVAVGAPRADRKKISRKDPEPLGRADEILAALTLGTKDYIRKNGFSRALFGLSGGVDSALTAAIAVKALGKENVTAVFMPSRFTSTASVEDSARVAENLGIEMVTVPIEPIFKTYLSALDPVFEDRPIDVTEENLQARIRGNLLMALSNKFNWILLSTGNKSEMSVGYATLYGDMNGGFAVIKDVSKTLAYELCRSINEKSGREVIPGRVLTKAPSAELRPDQKDSDALPQYSVLDPILQAYVEDELGVDEISALGYDMELVKKIISMVDKSEYKRRQAAPGVKITHRAFGKDWRVPITNLYRGS